MATNGESASRWLNDDASDLSPERVQQVKTNIQQKLDHIAHEDAEAPGLLEALDVLETYLNSADSAGLATPPLTTHNEPGVDHPDSDAPMFDTSLLIPDIDPDEPLSEHEKQRRFRQLMQENRFKPDN